MKNRVCLLLPACLSAVALTLPLFADVEWKYDTSKHPADDAVERIVNLPASAVRGSSTAALDSGAFCEAITGGCAFDSSPLGMTVIIR